MNDYKIDRYREGEFLNAKIKINSEELINKVSIKKTTIQINLLNYNVVKLFFVY